MLRLKRTPTTGVSIIWRERTGPSKRLIAKGLFYSLLIHLIMLLGFQIRAKLFDESAASPTPVVFLDSEEGAIALVGDSISSDEDPRVSLIRHMHLTDETVLVCAMPATRSLPSDPTAPSMMPLPPFHALPWGFSDELAPSRYAYRVYPLRISLHEGVRSLQLTEDGSRLFRKVTPNSIFITPSFSETHPTVEFSVDVSAATGTITRATCIRELVDKRLQMVAQQIIKSLCFEPIEKSDQLTISGVIALRFSGTYDSISPFLEEES
jgi:hypothetical protein